mmetsp:Transcript_51406/g.116908  ORF Transcript_51406/g.116908 Transcript_51406/m.116908 type:complete len:422 (+) Transcript_51406:241-1506(+)
MVQKMRVGVVLLTLLLSPLIGGANENSSVAKVSFRSKQHRDYSLGAFVSSALGSQSAPSYGQKVESKTVGSSLASEHSQCAPPASPQGQVLPESEVPCECAVDPLLSNRRNGSNHGRVLLYHGGGNALGNALLGYLTSYHDALRSGRQLRLQRGGIVSESLAHAFELAPDLWMTDKEVSKAGTKATIFFDTGKLQCPACISYLESKGFNSPKASGTRVVHSRPRNFRFDRSRRYLECYHRAVGCPDPKRGLNPSKQEADPEVYCGESTALRRLILGASAELRRLSPVFFSHWAGEPVRLERLLGHPGQAKRTGLSEPLWDVAVHARVEFPFVEQSVGTPPARFRRLLPREIARHWQPTCVFRPLWTDWHLTPTLRAFPTVHPERDPPCTPPPYRAGAKTSGWRHRWLRWKAGWASQPRAKN